MPHPTEIRAALREGGLVDITTTGRTSGQTRRIELGSLVLDGRVYISGRPGRRGWIANLRADPRMTFHIKSGLQTDLPATARVITDETERRTLMERICAAWNRQADVENFVASAPLIEVLFDDPALVAA